MFTPRPGSSRFAGGPKKASLAAAIVPPFSTAARSTEPALQNVSGSGRAWPYTRSRATPPSGKMRSRTCVARASAGAAPSTFAKSGFTAVRGISSTHARPPPASRSAADAATGSASSSSAVVAYGSSIASSDTSCGALPLKCVVSQSTPAMAPGVPRRRIA